MTADFETDPSASTDQPTDESLEDLRTRNASALAETTLEDEANRHEDLELPGADLSHEELIVHVLPKQADEFTCSRCFLVHHQSQRVTADDVCADCA